MNELIPQEVSTNLPFEVHTGAVATDAFANPFKLVVDPVMRMRLRKALFELIENHDTELAQHVADGRLALDSYKEYIEIFAHSLKGSMNSVDGVSYLLQACGFQVNRNEINLAPETRWINRGKAQT